MLSCIGIIGTFEKYYILCQNTRQKHQLEKNLLFFSCVQGTLLICLFLCLIEEDDDFLSSWRGSCLAKLSGLWLFAVLHSVSACTIQRSRSTCLCSSRAVQLQLTANVCRRFRHMYYLIQSPAVI